MTIGTRIRNRRIELNLTVDELAERLGKNRATIYRYENGEIENLPLDILSPIAEALETTPQFLMGWEPETKMPEYDPQIIEVIDLFSSLSEDKKQHVLSLLRLLNGK